jgi:hypothetical protein
LELHDKKSNIWKEIDYKKAVDKSSQALRERWEESDDDDVLQRSMTIMFNKKLQLNSQGRASRDSVEEAVYFAVMSVALEYAKRWGTKGVASLTEQLRPIVKSVGSKAIPRPNGEFPRPKVVAPSPLANNDARRSDASVKKSSATFKTRPMVAANRKTISTKAIKTTSRVSRSPSITKPPSAVIQATVNAPANKVSATPSARSIHNRQGVTNPDIAPVVTTTSHPMNRLMPETSHNFCMPSPFTTWPHIDQANTVPAPSAMQWISVGVESACAVSAGGDTFGAPAPAEHTPDGSQMLDSMSESASFHQPRRVHNSPPSAEACQGRSDGIIAADGGRSTSGDTFGQVISRTVPPLSQGPSVTSNGAIPTLPKYMSPTPPLNSTPNGFNTAKRKLSNIATQEEIEAENEKRPKCHGMSPFHREILKMNLQLLVDW